MDFFGVTVWTQSGMKVDPRQAPARRGVTTQHTAEDAVAPCGFVAAEEQTVGAIALSAAYRGLQRGLAALGDIRADSRFVLGRRRPRRGHHEIVHFEIRGVDGRLHREVTEV